MTSLLLVLEGKYSNAGGNTRICFSFQFELDGGMLGEDYAVENPVTACTGYRIGRSQVCTPGERDLESSVRELEDERDLLREQLAAMDGIVQVQERRCRAMEDEIQELQEELERAEENLANVQGDLDREVRTLGVAASRRVIRLLMHSSAISNI